jgi:NAD+ diphosphatase
VHRDLLPPFTAVIDRAGHRRVEEGLVSRLLLDPSCTVLFLDGVRAPVTWPVRSPRSTPKLTFTNEDRAFLVDFLCNRDHLLVFLGERPARDTGVPTPVLLVAAPEGTWSMQDVSGGIWASGEHQEGTDDPGIRWTGLREVGNLLDDDEADLFTTAVALVEWHASAGWCPACGQRTGAASAGWSRRCPGCGAEHFPHIAPAVIMAVTDEEERILLGRQPTWPERRFSVLAGFVEPGETIEDAVRREVAEETGVLVEDVRYVESQPWPFPSSLMLGCTARARTTRLCLDGREIVEARWWRRTDLVHAVTRGEILLPPRISIARRLIELWAGTRIENVEDIHCT